MIERVANSAKIQEVLQRHAKEVIATLYQEELHFSIVCDTSFIQFTPSLSVEMRERLGKVAVFILSGYSFQSLKIEVDYFEFEAGLVMQNGEDLGTVLRIPYYSVMQVIVQDDNDAPQSIMIYCNPFEFAQNQEMEDSIMAILSNNAHLLYRGKK